MAVLHRCHSLASMTNTSCVDKSEQAECPFTSLVLIGRPALLDCLSACSRC